MKGFRAFVLRGNVVDLAIAVVIGAAFGAVVTAFVKDLITPLIAATVGKPDFAALNFTIHHSKFLYGTPNTMFNGARGGVIRIDILDVYSGPQTVRIPTSLKLGPSGCERHGSSEPGSYSPRSKVFEMALPLWLSSPSRWMGMLAIRVSRSTGEARITMRL